MDGNRRTLKKEKTGEKNTCGRRTLLQHGWTKKADAVETRLINLGFLPPFWVVPNACSASAWVYVMTVRCLTLLFRPWASVVQSPQKQYRRHGRRNSWSRPLNKKKKGISVKEKIYKYNDDIISALGLPHIVLTSFPGINNGNMP